MSCLFKEDCDTYCNLMEEKICCEECETPDCSFKCEEAGEEDGE